jgi:hypothetical protein
MRIHTLYVATALTAPIALAQPALAAPGEPIKVSDSLAIDPIAEARLRYEGVDQPATEADALTIRLRGGVELKHNSGLSFLVEGEGTLAIVDNYNAFPFPIADSQRRPQYSVVPDPMNIDLNRLQLQYKSKSVAVTLGRQRINLDDQRWVGSVAWRQNEQTFDAVRGEAKFGPVSLDATYSNSQRTIFGVDAGPRQAYDGDFFLGGAGVKLGPVQAKGFAYLLDYEEPFFLTNSSQSYGLRVTAPIPITEAVKLNLVGSYARQSDYGDNPFDYSSNYISAEGALAIKGFVLTGGYELLGSDNGRAVQTPMATLHKFNGWADVFLVTPDNGLQDAYGGIAYKFDGVKALPGLNAAVTFHQFDSDVGDVEFGTEWDASVGFKLGPVALLAKYANYNAADFGVDTEKFWLQAEIAY